MIDNSRARVSLEKLWKLARADADALRVDLIDIEKARRAAETALADLEDAVKKEETASAQKAPAELAAYLDGARERRRNLRTTMITLSDAEETARARLEAAFIEIKKLEHLIEMQEKAVRKAGARHDLSAMDQIAALNARRS